MTFSAIHLTIVGEFTINVELLVRCEKLSCMHVINVLDLQACDSCILRVSCEVVYYRSCMVVVASC